MTKKKTKKTPEKLFAFWRYSTFPYLLGGTIVKMREDGKVETKEYGVGYYWQPVKILPVRAGRVLLTKLEALKQAYEGEQRRVREKYEEELAALLEVAAPLERKV